MNKKILSVASLVVVFTLSFFYVNQNFLTANDKDIKDCANKTACDGKNKDVKAGGEFESYEFTTDQACCDEMKNALQTDLLTVAGIKEVKFSPTCSVSKMTNVTVYFAAGETNSENIAAYVKDKNYDCPGSGCTKDGVKSGDKKEGCDSKKECTPNKETKNKETKNL
jgi:hypothetical protein